MITDTNYSLFDLIFSQWDTALIVIAAMIGMGVLSAWSLRQKFQPTYIALAWIPFLIILAAGFHRIAHDENLHKDMWIEMLKGVTTSFASATEEMGHAKITSDQSPEYKHLIKLHRQWHKEIPNIAYVYTLRRVPGAEKKTIFIVCAESDVDGDGQIVGRKECQKPYGEENPDWDQVYQDGFSGKIGVAEHIPSNVYDDYLCVVAPLYDREIGDEGNPYIEAILCVDFKIEQWQKFTSQIRSISMQLMALMLVVYLFVCWGFVYIYLLYRNVTVTNEELLAARQTVDAAAKAKSDFLVNMSHEIRTPMNALVSFTDILTRRVAQNCNAELKEETEGILDIIKKSSQDLLTIVNDVLDYIKIDANLLEIESVPVSIKQVIHDVCLIEKSKVVQKHLDFQIRYSGDVPPLILSDPVRLRQILMNIISNAVKFTEKGSISIVCSAVINEGSSLMAVIPEGSEPPGDSKATFTASSMLLKIDVIDTGIGMLESDIRKLFQPFMQADASLTRKYRGSGLGLSIAMRLAMLMDGTIKVQSEKGHGSTFSVLLNVYCPQGDSTILREKMLKEHPPHGSRLHSGLDIRMPKDPESNVPTANLPLRHARVLIVEDMAVNQVIMATLLREAGAQVELADNGAMGVQKVMQDADSGLFFDVILMDMQMPVMDGYEATAFLRKQNYDRPIIAVTAHALTGDREKTLQSGCNDYIAKPVDNQLLINTVKKYIG